MRFRSSVIERLREQAPNFAGLKVSDTPFEAVEPYLLEGLDVFVGAETLVLAGSSEARRARSPGSARSSRSAWSRSCATATATWGSCAPALDRFPFQAAAKYVLGRRGVPVREDVRAPLRRAERRREARAGRVARIVVAGAGATAPPSRTTSPLGARDVVLADRGRVAGGSTSKAMGGVRQQFSTAAEVRLAQESIRFFEELGAPLFEQVGYLFLATTEQGLAALEERRDAAGASSACRSRASIRRTSTGLRTDDVLGAVVCSEDGVADPPRGDARARPPRARSSVSRCARGRPPTTSRRTCS